MRLVPQLRISTSQLPKVARGCNDFYYCGIFTFKFALRHKGVQFLMSLASLLLDAPKPQNIIGKNTVFGDLSTFTRTLISFRLPFSSLIFFLLSLSLL